MNAEIIPLQPTQLPAVVTTRSDQHPAVVYLAGLSVGSRRTMAQALNVIAKILVQDEAADYLSIPWSHLRYQHTAALRATLAEKYTFSTTNKMLSALRGILKAAWKLGQMSAEDYHAASSVESVKGETVPAGRSLRRGELNSLLDTCEDDVIGIRDAAIISVLYGCGLRRAEVVVLKVGDYDVEDKTLRVRGKGNKERLVPVSAGVAGALADWLIVRGDEGDPLFVGTGNRNSGRALTTQAVYNMLQRRAAEARVSKLSPHDFRRTFVSDLLDAGADIVTAQKLAGHANIETTARYDRRGEQTKRQAVELLHVPYKRRMVITDSA